MKKTLFSILTAVCLLVAADAHAQQPDDAYKKELQAFIEASGSSGSFELVLDQVLMMAGDALSPQAKERVRQKASEQLIDLIAPVYQRHISLDDMKAMRAFYDTPAGRRIAAVMPQITAESMLVGQQWGVSLQSLIQDEAAE